MSKELTREETIAALRHCVRTVSYFDCVGCPAYAPDEDECNDTLMLRAAELLELYASGKTEDAP